MISRLTIHDDRGSTFTIRIRSKFLRGNSHQEFAVELIDTGTSILRFDDDVSSETIAIAIAIARKIWGNDERSKGWLPAAIAAGRQG